MTVAIQQHFWTVPQSMLAKYLQIYSFIILNFSTNYKITQRYTLTFEAKAALLFFIKK